MRNYDKIDSHVASTIRAYQNNGKWQFLNKHFHVEIALKYALKTHVKKYFTAFWVVSNDEQLIAMYELLIFISHVFRNIYKDLKETSRIVY